MADETILRQVFELEQIIDELFQLAEPGDLKNTLWKVYMRIAGPHPGDTETRSLPDVGDYIMVRRSPEGVGPAGQVLRTEGQMYHIYTADSGEMSFNIASYPYLRLLKASSSNERPI